MNGKLGRGFVLAAAAAVCLIVRGHVDILAAYRLEDPFFLALGLMLLPGAFLASLPRRIRNRGQRGEKASVRGCILAFVSGAAMIFGAGLAGGGDGLMLAGAAQGSVSAYVFLGVAALAAMITSRWRERRRGV